MKELIDKGSIFRDGVFLIDTNNPTASFGEMINRINNAPTTTEAEIRAKVIDEFAEKLKERFRWDSLYNKGYAISEINKIAEQLKEE